MVESLPEELLAQAKFLLTLAPNQANLRRAVSTSYYALFHLLIRSTVLNWGDSNHHARIGRMFEHKRMKEISAATIKSFGAQSGTADSNLQEVTMRRELTKVAHAFIILQQARHDADYNLEHQLDPADAVAQVDRAESSFAAGKISQESDAAREFLFLLLFKDKDRA